MDLEGLSKKKKHQRELDVGTKSLIMTFMRGLTFFWMQPTVCSGPPPPLAPVLQGRLALVGQGGGHSGPAGEIEKDSTL